MAPRGIQFAPARFTAKDNTSEKRTRPRISSIRTAPRRRSCATRSTFTTPTHAEVELEPDPIQEREPPLHVVGDELGHLLAAQHHLPSCRYISSTARRTRVRARWSTTRWFDS